MATPFVMTRDINGYNGFGLPFSDTNASATLTANADTTYTAPGTGRMGGAKVQTKNVWLVIFSFDPGASVWCSVNTAATLPVGNTFAATASCLNPASIQVNAGDVIHMITAGTGVNAGLQFYALY